MDVDTDTVTDSVPISSLDAVSRNRQIRKQKTKSSVKNLSGNVQGTTGGMWREGRDNLDLGLGEPKLMKYQGIKVQDVANEVLKVWNHEDDGESHMLVDNMHHLWLASVDSGNEDFTNER